MESCVHKYLYNYIIGNQILTPFQSGFVPGDYTTYQLLHTYYSFVEAVDSGKEVRVLFVISARPLTESGTRGYCMNYHAWELQEIYFSGLKVMFLTDDNVLFLTG